MIYLDNAATTKVRKEVLEVMMDNFSNNYANPDAKHNMGLIALDKINEEKKWIGKLLNIRNIDDICFTYGGSDGNNLLLRSIIEGTKEKKHIITTMIEHPSVYEVFKKYENDGYKVDYLKVDEYGKINIEELENLITSDTLLVSIISVNSELGIIQDISEIVKRVKAKNKKTYVHTDYVQGLGHANIDFKNIDIDAITVSGHKIYAPKGVGAVYLKKDCKIKDQIFGDNKQNGFIRRTLNSEIILGFLKACELMYNNYNEEINYLYNIKKHMIERLSEIENIRINSKLDVNESSPAILSVSIKDVKGEILLNYLSMNGICISTGSACSSKKGNSRIIRELNIPKEYEDGTIRISFSIYNTKEEIDKAADMIKLIVEKIRSFS